MWPFSDYFDRKSDAQQVDSLFWTINNDLSGSQFVFGYFGTGLASRIEKSIVTLRICRGTSHIIRCYKRDEAANSSRTPIWLSMRSSSHQILKIWCARINLVARNAACVANRVAYRTNVALARRIAIRSLVVKWLDKCGIKHKTPCILLKSVSIAFVMSATDKCANSDVM